MTSPGTSTSPWGAVPIGDYALLSDCENTCLVSPTGSIDWLCLPLPHDPSVFTKILDRKGGSLVLSVPGATVRSRTYVQDTLVLETLWESDDGQVMVKDFLAIDGSGAAHVLVRTATCLRGHLDIALTCDLRFNYALEEASWSLQARGTIKTINAAQPTITMTWDHRQEEISDETTTTVRLTAGDSFFVTLAWAPLGEPPTTQYVQDLLERTINFWRAWLATGSLTGPYKEQLARSALTLKALTYRPSGAILAAPTTSLPENPGGARNWDYRYSWLRDSIYTLFSLSRLGFNAETKDYLGFVLDRIGQDDNRLSIMYKVDGSDMGQETTLAQLEGYEGALPIRVGNAASDQLQLDTQGSFVNLVYEYSRSSTIDERTWDAVRRVVEQVVLLWPLPDNGLWEMRGPRQHFTFSKVMCWVALDRGAKVARLLGHVELADEWDQVARTVREQVLTNALCTAGYLGQYYGSDAPDAALLLMASLGFIEASHPVFRATVLKIAESLAEGPYVWRYRARTTPDGLAGEPEASFTICSFWLVQALCEIGEHDRARDNATALLASAGPLGLYAEQIDAVTGAHLGNFPQAFSHLALIDALETLTRLV